MEFQPRGLEAVERLLRRGVDIPNPYSLDIGPEVDLDRISGDRVTIYPGCRIYGAKTVISAGVTLGAEAPATVDDCRLGPGVALKGGYFSRSVFLAKANMGSGAQVREGTLLEEEANGAHCVGLKQTILFPFVTLGSLINFCDCLMAGGTSRRDHSEVGSSYIHFNFTPDGDKTTASLFGDVPRGVMLNQPPIFLGGQGGSVGPVTTGYGTVVAAGSVLRGDVPEDGRLVMVGSAVSFRRPVTPRAYRQLSRVVARNLGYLASLVAMEQWYVHVRRPFFSAQELGPLVYGGALEVLASARAERTKRLRAMISKVPPDDPGRVELRQQVEEMLALVQTPVSEPPADLLTTLREAAASGVDYVTAIQGLPAEAAATGTRWLQGIIDDLCARADGLLPALKLFAAR